MNSIDRAWMAALFQHTCFAGPERTRLQGKGKDRDEDAGKMCTTAPRLRMQTKVSAKAGHTSVSSCLRFDSRQCAFRIGRRPAIWQNLSNFYTVLPDAAIATNFFPPIDF